MANIEGLDMESGSDSDFVYSPVTESSKATLSQMSKSPSESLPKWRRIVTALDSSGSDFVCSPVAESSKATLSQVSKSPSESLPKWRRIVTALDSSGSLSTSGNDSDIMDSSGDARFGKGSSSVIIPATDSESDSIVEDESSPIHTSGSGFESWSTPPEEVLRRMSLKSLKSQGPPDSIIDLTCDESVRSLENSPVGARVQDCDINDVVTEISEVTHELQSKQIILDTINTNNLPDKGDNLFKQVDRLQKRKTILEDKLATNKMLVHQKASLLFYDSGKDIKNEVQDHEAVRFAVQPPFQNSQSEPEIEEDEPIESSSHDPEWRDIPLAGLGKRALKTHFTEKVLTVDTLSKLHSDLKSCPSEDQEEDDPKGLKVDLMPHQKHALAWMLWREANNPSGGILADDMGLGKTLTMISLILKSIQHEDESDDSDSENETPNWLNSKYSKMYKGGTLVICPASVIGQWENEIKKKTKRGLLEVEMYHGCSRESKPRRLARADVVLTTFHLVGREAGVNTAKTATMEKVKGPLFYIKWDRIILDEAHVVRNHKSLMSQAVCDLIAKHRWCLTGTPIHNKQLDLYSLLKFLRCAPFDDLSVWKRWVDNKDPSGMQRLNTMMKSLLLRRTKDQLLKKGELKSLPDKMCETILINLDPEELELYEKIAEYSRTLFAQYLGQRAEKQQVLDARYGFSTLPTWEQTDRPDDQFQTTAELAQMHRKMQGLAEIKTFEILMLLLRLRQACCHPNLVTKMVEESDLGSVEGSEQDVDDLSSRMSSLDLQKQFLPNCDAEAIEEEKQRRALIMSPDNPVFSLDRPSAKVRAALDILEEKVLGTPDKAIIVSQWTSFLSIFLKYLKGKGVKCDTLSGEIPVLKRQDIVDSFNRSIGGPQVLLLSLTAGGVGLNLVGANHLLLVDLHWNPQLEAQACDRIYRVGQKKPCFIYRFITVDTIEERVRQMQENKLALANDVLTGTTNSQASKLTLDDLKMLFSVGVPKPLPL